MLRSLRAVGESVPAPDTAVGCDVWPLDSGLERYWYASGTAALAASLQAIIRVAGKSQPSFLVPAYTCPDVLSAIEFAGAKAVAVDFVAERPWLSVDCATQRADNSTVGIIAINFQGIAERVEQLRLFADQINVPLIYDHCQGFPVNDAAMLLSDVAVFSFGRGKPAAALTGGAVVVNRRRQSELSFAAPENRIGAPSAAKRQIYNALINPYVYGWPAKLPFLAIGQTVYHPLEQLAGLDDFAVAAINTAIQTYQQCAQTTLPSAYREWLPDTWDLAALCGANERLLRLPVLLPSAEAKSQALASLVARGLGASPLYPVVLSELPGVPAGLVRDEGAPHAREFAARLLTLPLHSDVTRDDVAAMQAQMPI